MSLSKTTVVVNNIQSLSDTPSSAEGLTTQTFKAKFDQTGADLKTYINSTLTEELDTLITGIQGDITDIEAELNGIDVSTLLVKANNLSDVTSASTSRTNLGLGSIATRNITVSTGSPSGGSDGDIWIKYS